MNKFSTMKSLYMAQLGRCFHCGEVMDKNPWSNKNRGGWSREHVHPKSLGGGHEYNIVLAHPKCNSKRGRDFLSKKVRSKASFIMLIAEEIRNDALLRKLYEAA